MEKGPASFRNTVYFHIDPNGFLGSKARFSYGYIAIFRSRQSHDKLPLGLDSALQWNWRYLPLSRYGEERGSIVIWASGRPCIHGSAVHLHGNWLFRIRPFRSSLGSNSIDLVDILYHLFHNEMKR